jgi:hypothetical protein
MNSQSKKLGFFHSFEEMQKTFEKLNLTTNGYDRMRFGLKLPKINKHKTQITKNSELSENMDNKEALIYNIPELVLRRNWNPDTSNLVKHEPKVLKNHSESLYPNYIQEIKRSAQIARISGRYPPTKVITPRFKIVLPSIQRKAFKTSQQS